MATCSKCGSQMAEGVKFCPGCGVPIGVVPGPPGNDISPPLAASASPEGGLAPNVVGLLVYLPLCLIGLVCSVVFGFVLDPYKQNRSIRFHAWQSLAERALEFGHLKLTCG